MFLSSGARLYPDAGAHQELATPECPGGPAELLRYAIAGDRMLGRLAVEECQRSRRLSEIVLARTNVDYLTGATFGSHENYAHALDPSMLWRRIPPHLVSRIVFTGAGGLDVADDGVGFVLSPRVSFPRARQLELVDDRSRHPPLRRTSRLAARDSTACT